MGCLKWTVKEEEEEEEEEEKEEEEEVVGGLISLWIEYSKNS